jgi:hypothetical protein
MGSLSKVLVAAGAVQNLPGNTVGANSPGGGFHRLVAEWGQVRQPIR